MIYTISHNTRNTTDRAFSCPFDALKRASLAVADETRLDHTSDDAIARSSGDRHVGIVGSLQLARVCYRHRVTVC